MLYNVLPSTAQHDHPNAKVGDAIFSSKRLESAASPFPELRSDRADILLCEGSTALHLSPSCPSFSGTVLAVFGERPEKEMLRVDAEAVVARMTNGKATRVDSCSQEKRESMGAPIPMIYRLDKAVAVSGATVPVPAFGIGFPFDSIPDALHEFYGELGNCFILAVSHFFPPVKGDVVRAVGLTPAACFVDYHKEI